jgi:thioesterase domain-containing protein
MNRHSSILNRLLWMQDEYGLTESDSVLQKTTFSFDVSVWEFFWPLITGARLLLARPGGQQDSQYLVETIIKEEIATLHFVPSMLQVFLQQPGVEMCGSLKRVICSGEALPFELQERFYDRLEADLHNLYGPTEAAVDVTYWHCRPYSSKRLTPIGRPIANTQIYVLSRRIEPAPTGVYGELHIGGKNLARGYLGRADLTAEKFIPNPFAISEGERLYSTGDLARFLPDGNIEFLRRIDHQVKIRGFRIELGEIESALRGHPSIKETVVLAREDVPGDKRLVAYIVAGDDSLSGIDELRGYLKERLPEYMIPAAFVKLDSIPLTPNGKIDRRMLPAPGKERPDLEQGPVDPRDALEMLLAWMWQDVLGIERVGVHDDFFRLGGDSIKGAVFINRLQEKLSEIVHVVVIFKAATIAQLAAYIKQHYPAAAARLCGDEIHSSIDATASMLRPSSRAANNNGGSVVTSQRLQMSQQSGSQAGNGASGQSLSSFASTLVPLQSEGSEPPFFCVHPVGGDVFCYVGLARGLGNKRPFYALRARGLDEGQTPLSVVEEMAADYIEAMRAAQPEGPYLLGGWSFGGVVAYEMACKLQAEGQTVARLILIDTPAPQLYDGIDENSAVDKLALMARFAQDLGLSLDRLSVSPDQVLCLDENEQLALVLKEAQGANILSAEITASQARRLYNVFRSNLQATRKYAPSKYDGRVILVKSSDKIDTTRDEPAMGWERLASGELETHTVPGDHYSIVTGPELEVLVDFLKKCFDED